ncbi:T9SS type A sorting domain-containing protein [Mangrovimonas xylaniphaga]|uniref:T9SS type A sorting domain-containing protein n=1 Tax=Mangrovimonas xylaniphaga TaxID=1645915 RepID=UPI0006B45EB3|nr:T9SS type A sorting domain-containing protein [Mangrovimonas xylaniphaga]
MKKITLVFMLLTSMITYSQIDIYEDFESYSTGNLPSGWNGDFETTSTATNSSNIRCGSRSFYTLANSASTKTFTTKNLPGVSNGTNAEINFNYKIVGLSTSYEYQAPEENWGTFVFEYTTNGTDWTTIGSIDDNNYTYDGTCHAASYTIDASNLPEGVDFQFRGSFNLVNRGSSYYVYAVIDDLSILQTAIETPNCDSALTSETTNVAISMPTISWNSASGLPSGYNIAIGLTSEDYTFVASTDVGNSTEFTLPNTLEYSTTYYVLITPYNAFGSATECTAQTFTTRAQPAVGASCDNAHIVNTFPYSTSDNTDNYENTYNTSPCTATYMKGKDVFYEITPSNDISINVNLLDINSNGTSLSVVEGCVDAATNCLAYEGSFGITNRSFEDLLLYAGNTYYIVISGSNSTQTFTYTLEITQNSLTNAEVNFEGFRYYPNPVKNSLTFESPNMISSVAIYNVVGQKVLATAGNNTMSTVNMSALPNGIYFAKVNIDGAEKTIKIIKE